MDNVDMSKTPYCMSFSLSISNALNRLTLIGLSRSLSFLNQNKQCEGGSGAGRRRKLIENETNQTLLPARINQPQRRDSRRESCFGINISRTLGKELNLINGLREFEMCDGRI